MQQQTHRSMLRFQVILQASLGLVRLAAVSAIEHQLLQLRLRFTTLLHMVHVAHDAGEPSTAALLRRGKPHTIH